MTHGFKNGRVIAEQGTVERTGVGEFLKFDDGTDSFQTFSSDGTPEGSVTADKGSVCHDITNGALYVKTTDGVNTGWNVLGNTSFPAGMLNSDGAGTTTGRTIIGTTDFIDVADGTGVSGNPTLSINTKFEETGMHGWNGCLLETASVTAASDGATITFSVELSGGGDLDVVFSDGYYLWDTTPADTVTLTEGTDTVPVQNYVYFLQSTKTLTASTVGWPASEHAPLATILCQSAATFQTDGPYKFHAWTDHVISSFNEGHIPDINFWIRKQAATYESGVAQTFTITTNGGAADNVILTTASGVVLQLHDQTFPAFSGTPDVYVVNDNATPYTKVTDLNALLTDSTGASMTGKYFSLVIWGCVSENSSDCKLFCNLPGGSYNSSANLLADPDKYANFNIPSDFTGTGFLIAQWNLRHQSSSGGTWTSIEEIDLRGLFPAIVPGGSSAFPSEFVDTAFRIFDDGDDTKKIAFEASEITTATTRTLTVQDSSGTIALEQNLGISYSAGVFTVRGADADLSSTNVARISLQSKATPGELVNYSITANQSFIDDAGASEIIGNLFGLTTGVAYASDIPFFLYAVGNDDEDTIAFMISRYPAARVAPAAANIGAPDDAVADAQNDFWSLDNIDETLYDGNPCICIGSFRMQMSASDDWTVQTILNTDGVGQFNDQTWFDLPEGVFGGQASTYWQPNAGTEPQFATNSVKYRLDTSGVCDFRAWLQTVDVAGVGAQDLELTLPYIVQVGGRLAICGLVNSSSSTRDICQGTIDGGDQFVQAMYVSGTSSKLANGNFATGYGFDCILRYQILYP